MKYDAFKRDDLITLIKLRDDQISQKNMAIQRFINEIESLKEVINKHTNAINELNEQLINKYKLIKKYKKTITDNENNLSLKNDRIQELEMTIKDIKAQRDAARNANCNSGRYPWGPKPSRLSDQINLIEKRLNALENYIFGGKKDD